MTSQTNQLKRRFYFLFFNRFFNAVEEVILAEERTTDEERRHIIEGNDFGVFDLFFSTLHSVFLEENIIIVITL